MNPIISGLLCVLVSSAVSAQQPPPPPPPPKGPAADLVQQAQQQMRDGRGDEAIALVRKAIAVQPDSFQAHNQAGIIFDLMGNYDDARTYFRTAIEIAPTPQQKISAHRALTISYGFTNDCANAVKAQTPAVDYYVAQKDAYMTGEMANEVARICLESGDVDTAATWYARGHEEGLKEPNISDARKDLWEFRWESALARVAVRRGHKDEARQHVAAAKAILDKGPIAQEQGSFMPYLAGYVDFYLGDYTAAIAELQSEKANQSDPFVMALLAQAYEKTGDAAKAKEYYEKIMAATIHNPTAAYARPIARKKLGPS